jgi:hypothetical protein
VLAELMRRFDSLAASTKAKRPQDRDMEVGGNGSLG